MIKTFKDKGDSIAEKRWRLENLYFINTKDKKLEPIQPNNAQLDFLLKRTGRDFILKARQLGFSTFCLIDLLDETMFTRNTHSAILAHEKQKVVKLFEIVKRAYDNLPNDPRIKPRVSFENRNELYFPDLNSKIYVTMDTRGETVHNLHVSELAFVRNAELRLAATLESVPKNGKITFETTANGMSNFAFDEWDDVNSEYAKFFYSWLWDEDYRMKTEKTMEELMDEYRPFALQYGLKEKVVEEFDLDKEQFAFYLSKVKRHKQLVLQEYPLDDMEAFISSGKGVFHMNDLQRHVAQTPETTYYGDCLVWEEPLEGFRYSVGVDSSEGLGQDNAVIQVLNAHTGFQAAEFASPNIPPDQLATYVLNIAKKYNNALIVPEINSSGISLLDHIKHKYHNIYRREVFDKRTRETRDAPGWRTTGTSKPLLVNALEEAVREDYIVVNSKDTLKEMKTFVRTEEQGKQGFGAEGTKHDDRVIALGLAYQGIKFLPKMKKAETVAQQKLREFIERKNLEKHFPEQKVEGILKDRKKKYFIRSNR